MKSFNWQWHEVSMKCTWPIFGGIARSKEINKKETPEKRKTNMEPAY